MKTLKLTPEDAAAIQRILNTEDIPENPEQEAFTEAINKIMETDPELAQRYILAVPIAHPTKPTQNLLRSEEEARKARFRQLVLNTQRALLMRKVEGDWVPSQPKIWTVALIVLAVALSAAIVNYINVTENQRRIEVVVPPEVTVAVPTPEPVPAVTPTPPAVLDLPPAPVLNLAPAPTLTPTPAPTPSPLPALPAAPPSNLPPLPNLNPPAAAGGEGYDDAGIAYEVDLTQPMTVNRQAAQPSGLNAPSLGLYRQTATPQTAPGGVLNSQISTFRDTARPQTTTIPTNDMTILASMTVARNAPGIAPIDVLTQTTPTTSISIPVGEREIGSITVATNQVTETVRITRSTGGSNQAPTNQAPANQAPAMQSSNQNPSSGNQPPTLQAAPQTPPVIANRANTLLPGQRVNAQLVTSATIIDGQAAPVAIETVCSVREETCVPTTFFGQASLVGGNRIIININTMIQMGNVTPIQAIALGPNNTTNIPAYITEETPTIANDMFRSAIAGLGTYVEALANQTTVTYVGETVIEERPAPNLIDYIGGNVANLFSFQNSTTSFVRLAEIPAGTSVTVLIGTSY